MRVSTYEGDDGYEAYEEIIEAGLGVSIFLDGKMLPANSLVMADERRGLVEVVASDEEGSAWKTCQGQIATRFLLGEVRIVVHVRTSH